MVINTHTWSVCFMVCFTFSSQVNPPLSPCYPASPSSLFCPRRSDLGPSDSSPQAGAPREPQACLFHQHSPGAASQFLVFLCLPLHAGIICLCLWPPLLGGWSRDNSYWAVSAMSQAAAGQRTPRRRQATGWYEYGMKNVWSWPAPPLHCSSGSNPCRSGSSSTTKLEKPPFITWLVTLISTLLMSTSLNQSIPYSIQAYT